MKVKQVLSLLCTGVLMCGLLSVAAAAAEIETEMGRPAKLAEITAIDGSTVTLQLLGRGQRWMGMTSGRGGQMTGDKTPPTSPEGEALPELAEGEMPPEKPEGDTTPVPTDGEEIPEMPEKGRAVETVTVDLSDLDTVGISELAVGDLLSIELDEDGMVISVTVAELPELPEKSERPEMTENTELPEFEAPAMVVV